MTTQRKIMLFVSVVLLMSLTFVSSASALRLETTPASGDEWKGTECFAVFYIPHDTLQFPLGTGSSKYRPYIGGIDFGIIGLIHDHNDPTHWDFRYRNQISKTQDKLYLSVPKSYVALSWISVNDNYPWYHGMYIQYFRP